MDSNNVGTQQIPKLQGSSNYQEWQFRVKLAIRQTTFGMNKKKQEDELDMKVQAIIVNSISDRVLGSIMHCKDHAEMLKKLDTLYGLNEEDLDQLQLDFQTFKYDRELSLQENVSRLETIRQKIHKLGDKISDSAFRTRLLSSLPRRFNSFISATHLAKDITLDALISALASEDHRLQRNFDEKKDVREKANSKSLAMICHICQKPGHKSAECYSKKSSGSNSAQKLMNSNDYKLDEITCKYCKVKGHIVKNCPELEKRKNATCNACNEKGHYAKNCPRTQTGKSLISNFTACLNVELMSPPIDGKLNPNSWFLDCACTTHVCNNESYLTNVKTCKGSLVIADDKPVNIEKKGTVLAKCGAALLKFEEVILNSKAPANLVSFSTLLKRNWSVKKFTLNEIVLEKNDIEIIATRDENDLWELPVQVNSQIHEPESDNMKSNHLAMLSLSDWHRKFAHQNMKYVKDILDRHEIKYSEEETEKCVACLKGKATRHSFKASKTTTSKVGELVHADLLSMPTASLGGSKYALVIKDDFSKFRFVYFLKHKSETCDCFEDFFRMCENQTGNRIKKLRTDNGTEEVNSDIEKLCSKNGIIHERSCPFTPEQNGKAEREIRTLSEAAGTILIDAKMPKFMWAEAMLYAAFTINRTGKTRIPNKTPYEVFFNKPCYEIRNLEAFGTKVVIQIPKQKRKKLDPKGEEGIFIGYPPNVKGTKIYFPHTRKIVVSRNVEFIREIDRTDTNEPVANLDEDDENDIVTELDVDWTDDDDEPVNEKAMITFQTPKSFKEISAMHGEGKRIWQDAINAELESMKKHTVWEAVKYESQHLVDTKWVFRLKVMENGPIAKARLVARGFMSDNFEETYAPVVSITTVRTCIAIACYWNFKMVHIDVETAFLHGILKEEVFIKPPEGIELEENYVLRLKKALYGLKQSPKCWNDKLNKVLLDRVGCKRSKNDRCLYFRKEELIILVYVDDALIMAKNDEAIRRVIEILEAEFIVKVFNTVEHFIGLNIQIENGKIRLNQTKFISELATKYGLNLRRKTETPMEMKIDFCKLNSTTTNSCVTKFQKLLGSLNYVCERSRPDISYAVNKLSRFANCATEEHFKYLLRILKYLKYTEELEMVYENHMEAESFECFCDASFGDDEFDRKSTSGYLIRLFGNLVHYKTRKQTLVTQSSTEAEYVALAEACRDLIWIKSMLKELGIEPKESVIHEDNLQTINIVRGQTNPKRTRHIDTKYHFVKDLAEKKIISLKYIETQRQVADLLTKAKDSTTFKALYENLNLKK
jgi:transposase InsO family protein